MARHQLETFYAVNFDVDGVILQCLEGLYEWLKTNYNHKNLPPFSTISDANVELQFPYLEQDIFEIFDTNEFWESLVPYEDSVQAINGFYLWLQEFNNSDAFHNWSMRFVTIPWPGKADRWADIRYKTIHRLIPQSDNPGDRYGIYMVPDKAPIDGAYLVEDKYANITRWCNVDVCRTGLLVDRPYNKRHLSRQSIHSIVNTIKKDLRDIDRTWR